MMKFLYGTMLVAVTAGAAYDIYTKHKFNKALDGKQKS